MPGIYKFEKMLWKRVQFSKVWSLQPATLLLAYSFIRHELLYRLCSSFYVLFRNKHLRNITCWLLLLFVNCEMLFNFIFRTFPKHAFCENYLVAAPIICWLRILNVEKTIEQQKQSHGRGLLKKVLLKILKKSQENICARVSFLVKF